MVGRTCGGATGGERASGHVHQNRPLVDYPGGGTVPGVIRSATQNTLPSQPLHRMAAESEYAPRKKAKPDDPSAHYAVAAVWELAAENSALVDEVKQLKQRVASLEDELRAMHERRRPSKGDVVRFKTASGERVGRVSTFATGSQTFRANDELGRAWEEVSVDDIIDYPKVHSFNWERDDEVFVKVGDVWKPGRVVAVYMNHMCGKYGVREAGSSIDHSFVPSCNLKPRCDA